MLGASPFESGRRSEHCEGGVGGGGCLNSLLTPATTSLVLQPNFKGMW